MSDLISQNVAFSMYSWQLTCTVAREVPSLTDQPDNAKTPFSRKFGREKGGVAKSHDEATFYHSHIPYLTYIKVLVVLKIMYEGKKKKVVTSSFCRAVARHSTPRARPGGAESADLPVYHVFRRCMFEFYA